MNDTISAPKGLHAIDGGIEDGIVWATCKAPMYGAVNGYVQIPEDHPWHGLDYDEIDVHAPGGLTFARDGWIGFDTLHSWDFWPGGIHYCHDDECDCILWTPEMVADATRELAQHVAEADAVQAVDPRSAAQRSRKEVLAAEQRGRDEVLAERDEAVRQMVAQVIAARSHAEEANTALADLRAAVEALADETDALAKTLTPCTGSNCAGCRLGVKAARLRAIVARFRDGDGSEG